MTATLSTFAVHADREFGHYLPAQTELTGRGQVFGLLLCDGSVAHSGGAYDQNLVVCFARWIGVFRTIREHDHKERGRWPKKRPS